jgi:hypothetical protein
MKFRKMFLFGLNPIGEPNWKIVVLGHITLFLMFILGVIVGGIIFS